MSKSDKNITVLAVALLLVLVGVYANHFNNGFHFDDTHTVVDNVHIRSLKNIPQFFTDPRMFSADPAHWSIRPLVTTSLAIDCWFAGGLYPSYFQTSTFIEFVLMGAMLFFMFRNLLKNAFKAQWSSYVALGATAWYMLNTANAETINYIISRSDVLSTFFIVASFLIYIAYPRKRNTFLYLIPAAIGAFAKETVLVLVILVFFYTLIFEDELSLADLFKPTSLHKIGRAIVKILPLLIVVGAIQYYIISKVSSSSLFITHSFSDYVITQSWIWVHYFITFFLPLNLSADTDWTIIPNVFDERIIIGILFIIALIVTIFKTSAKKETKPIAFGLIWFAAALLPTTLMPLAEVTNDHRMFFPFIGLALSATTYIALLIKKSETKIASSPVLRNLVLIAIILVLGLNAYGITKRNQVWRNEETLWLDVTQKSPLNGRGLMNYGLTQMTKGNYDVADRYFESAVPLLPTYHLLYINIGILKGAMGNHQEAETNFQRAISLSPNTYEEYAFYGRYLQQIKNNTKAITMAQKALQINPYATVALYTLMDAYNDLGMTDKLHEAARQTLAIIPDDATALSFLNAKPQSATAIPTNQHTRELEIHQYLDQSVSYYNGHYYNQCIAACLEILKLDPQNADAYSNMSAAYNQMKQWQLGANAAQKALKINPHHKFALGNLNWAKSNLK
ncbi:hypothetical protein [Mucilaginibacter sp. dw_454]|uniref:tetratricopeptide repeat protein n=1 Tax=Mucilaginibacter sp. dw_454 TaxID=2720079 RepID=UPI001BD25013|nr:hypothetical protein [Mucilaginibacter sp. dw_454]